MRKEIVVGIGISITLEIEILITHQIHYQEFCNLQHFLQFFPWCIDQSKVKIKYLTIIPFVDNAACDVEQDDVRLNVDKAGCAEKDESSFASYPRSSINANSEFHFEFKQNNAGRYVLSIYKKKLLNGCFYMDSHL